ncbi:prepilin-type N-terminal cleavage/methylation domain-containing protein [Opitutaceae bacterium TAV3]|nr:prepilin-type N-terminal cleavage/methylation domain-containing protein [Opitutaceae bacterium TAV3]
MLDVGCWMLDVGRSRTSRQRRARGFTLVEVLLVILIMGLISSVMITGSSALFNASQTEDPEEALLALLQTVRLKAVEDGMTLDLVTEDEGFSYFYGNGHSKTLPEVEGVKVRLIKAEGAQSVLLGGQVEETPVNSLRFFNDGTCAPVRVQVQRGNVRKVLVIDPWTCAALPPHPNAR